MRILSHTLYISSYTARWTRPKRRFPYRFEGKTRHYNPDFYLPETDEWIEIKGYPTDKDFAKWDAFPHPLLVLNGRDLFEQGLIESYSPVDREYRGKSWNT